MNDGILLVTETTMLQIAKKLRLKAYYDTGDSEGDSDHAAAVREARSTTLISVAEIIDETLKIDSTLTQADLASWRR